MSQRRSKLRQLASRLVTLREQARSLGIFADDREQLRALNELIRIYGETHRFTAGDVRKIHKIWLGPVYAWAGEYQR